MRNHIAARLLLAAGIGLLAQGAVADPEMRGVIRDVDASKGWVVIGPQRFTFTEKLAIRNLASSGDDRRALQKDLPVRYSTNSRNQLTEIWIYPADPALRARLGYGSPAE